MLGINISLTGYAMDDILSIYFFRPFLLDYISKKIDVKPPKFII